MRINFNNAHKLRSGITVWRCMLEGRTGQMVVYVQEILLAGSKTKRTMRSMFPEELPEKKRPVLSSSLRIGPKDGKLGTGNYLNDLHGHGAEFIAAFTTRREAMRWKRLVESGLLPEAVEARGERDAENRLWDMMDDDYADPFYDYDDPEVDACGPCDCEECKPSHYPSVSDEGSMTLGDLLRKKLNEQAEGEANDGRFAMPA